MPVRISEVDGNIVMAQVTARLVKEDLERSLPEVERIIEKSGKIYVLIELMDFEGGEPVSFSVAISVTSSLTAASTAPGTSSAETASPRAYAQGETGRI